MFKNSIWLDLILFNFVRLNFKFQFNLIFKLILFLFSYLKGSDPLAGESETDYVARQRKLQDEVSYRNRER